MSPRKVMSDCALGSYRQSSPAGTRPGPPAAARRSSDELLRRLRLRSPNPAAPSQALLSERVWREQKEQVNRSQEGGEKDERRPGQIQRGNEDSCILRHTIENLSSYQLRCRDVWVVRGDLASVVIIFILFFFFLLLDLLIASFHSLLLFCRVQNRNTDTSLCTKRRIQCKLWTLLWCFHVKRHSTWVTSKAAKLWFIIFIHQYILPSLFISADYYIVREPGSGFVRGLRFILEETH